MIIDTLENAALYRPLGPRLASGLDYIGATDFSVMVPGRYPIDGDRLIAIVDDYQTIACPEVELEGHRRYIDIQYLVSGAELLGYASLLDQKPFQEYDPDRDFTLYRGEATFIDFKAGMFCILYPHDLHMPCVGEPPVPVRKVVVKVMI